MTFKEYPSLVIAGVWNLGILTPQWYAREFPDLIKQKEFPVEMQIGTGALRFTIENIVINPNPDTNPDRLIFFSQKDEDSQYDLIEKLAVGTVTKLPHTPIAALGHNVSYFTDEKKFRLFDPDVLDKSEDFYKKEVSVSSLNTQRTIHCLSYENFTLNLTYEFNRKKNSVSFNYHYDVSNIGIDKIGEYILDFRKNIKNAEALMMKIIGEK